MLFNVFEPGWKSNNPLRREKAVKHQKDIKILTSIVENDLCPDVRRAALSNIEWDACSDLIKKVAVSDVDDSVRKEAIAKIKDEVVLCSIIQQEKNKGNRFFAVEQILDNRFLVSLALNKKICEYTREFAVSRIVNQQLLVDIAKEADSFFVFSEAIKQIKDKSLLLEIIDKAQNVGAVQFAKDIFSQQSNCYKCKIPKAKYYCTTCKVSICGNCIDSNHLSQAEVECNCPKCNGFLRKEVFYWHFD